MNLRSYFSTPRDLPDSRLRRAADAVANLLYPEECVACETPVSRSRDRSVCSGCWKRILELQIGPPWCPSCGIPYQQWNYDSSHLCGDCIPQLPPYSAARSFGYYSAELRKVTHALKFRGRRNLASLLAPLMASAYLNTWEREEFDLIVPMPLHPRRARERGFNQTEELSRPLARLLGIPYDEGVLRRARETVPQVGLSDGERALNLRGAFRPVNHRLLDGRKVLLVDDVMTTGATAESATRALLKGGAARVCVLVLARAVKGLTE